MWRVKMFFNWFGWCIRFRELVPWNVGYVSRRKPTVEDIKRGLEIAREFGSGD